MSDVHDRIESLLEMTEEDPSDALAHFMLAQEYQRIRDWEEAIPYFEVVRDLDPTYTAAYKGLGYCLNKVGEVDLARDTWLKGLEVADQTGDLQTAREMEVFLRRIGVDLEK